MKICGPKLSLCGLIISVWGIFQLVLMGIFYYVKSVALSEDLPGVEEGNFKSPQDFYQIADRGYVQNAYNCWIAACLYIFTLVLSGHQFYVNSRSSLKGGYITDETESRNHIVWEASAVFIREVIGAFKSLLKAL